MLFCHLRSSYKLTTFISREKLLGSVRSLLKTGFIFKDQACFQHAPKFFFSLPQPVSPPLPVRRTIRVQFSRQLQIQTGLPIPCKQVTKKCGYQPWPGFLRGTAAPAEGVIPLPARQGPRAGLRTPQAAAVLPQAALRAARGPAGGS